MSTTVPAITAEVFVSGCPLCEEALDQVDGGYDVRATDEPPEAVVRFDPATTSVQALTRATKSVGNPSDLAGSR